MRIRPYYVYHMSALCRELEGYLRRFYRTDCHLSLFGSAGNGFGLLGSDADICLRFGPEVRPEVNFKMIFVKSDQYLSIFQSKFMRFVLSYDL